MNGVSPQHEQRLLQQRQVGERVQKARKTLRYSQAAVAKGAGVSENTVISIENGRHRTQPEKLRKVLEFLGLTPLGDAQDLKMDGVPADAQVFLMTIAKRLAAMDDERRRAVLLSRGYTIFLDDANGTRQAEESGVSRKTQN